MYDFNLAEKENKLNDEDEDVDDVMCKKSSSIFSLEHMFPE
jgi:hypothetical protein